MRLIDADALGIGKASRDVFNKPEYADGWNSAVAIIEDAPTVDAVEVVRCKDCIHRDPEDKRCDDDMGMGRGIFRVNDNDFCSYGERKASE